MTNKGLLRDIPADQWDKIKILDDWTTLMTGKMEEGKFVSREAFNSIVSLMGGQEVKYELVNQQETESEVQVLTEKVEEITLKETENKPQNNVRNVMLIGKTGNGKSTLANVLVNKNNNFEEVFKESASSVSETKTFQSEIIKVGNIEYRIIDTIGISDTKLGPQEVLKRIANAAYTVKEGLNQVLFVASGRFTNEEVSAYNLLRTVIFDGDIARYTTIVRTNFPSFDQPEEWEKDKKRLIAEASGETDGKRNEALLSVIRSCNKILYVDNPPVENVRASLAAVNREIREESRNILLTHLNICDDVYKPHSLDELNNRIGDYMTDAEIQKKAIDDLMKKVELSAKEKIELKERAEKYEKLMEEVHKQTAQVVEQRQPGFFERCASNVGWFADTLNPFHYF